VPVAGLERTRRSWLKLGELWGAALVLNLAGGIALAVLLTSRGVLRAGTGGALARLADHIAAYDATTAFLSAVVAGGLRR